MLSPSDFNNAVPQFTNGNYASNPINPQYVAEPDAENYNRGTEPLQTLPAQWWNWFINKFTARFNKVNIYVKNIFNELAQVLSIFNITPDGTEQTPTTSQLKTVFECCYPQYVKNDLYGNIAGTALGTAAVGTATTFARSDHVHPYSNRIKSNDASSSTYAEVSDGNTLNIYSEYNWTWLNYKGGANTVCIGAGNGTAQLGTVVAANFVGLATNATNAVCAQNAAYATNAGCAQNAAYASCSSTVERNVVNNNLDYHVALVYDNTQIPDALLAVAGQQAPFIYNPYKGLLSLNTVKASSSEFANQLIAERTGSNNFATVSFCNAIGSLGSVGMAEVNANLYRWDVQGMNCYKLLDTSQAVLVSEGGTGATTAAAARNNLGLGSAAQCAVSDFRSSSWYPTIVECACKVCLDCFTANADRPVMIACPISTIAYTDQGVSTLCNFTFNPATGELKANYFIGTASCATNAECLGGQCYTCYDSFEFMKYGEVEVRCNSHRCASFVERNGVATFKDLWDAFTRIGSTDLQNSGPHTMAAWGQVKVGDSYKNVKSIHATACGPWYINTDSESLMIQQNNTAIFGAINVEVRIAANYPWRP